MAIEVTESTFYDKNWTVLQKLHYLEKFMETNDVDFSTLNISTSQNEEIVTLTVTGTNFNGETITFPKISFNTAFMSYKGEWTANTVYEPLNVVSYNGLVYLCIANIAGEIPPSEDTSDWVMMAQNGTSFTIMGSVDTAADLPEPSESIIGQAYFVGTEAPREVYVCLSYNNQILWENEGVLQGATGERGEKGDTGQGYTYQGTWTAIHEYNPYDCVTYQGTTYVCIRTTSEEAPPDSVDWEVFAQGVYYAGDWNSNTHYYLNDIVKYNNIIYVCISPIISVETPDEDTTHWEVLIETKLYKHTTVLSDITATFYLISDNSSSSGGLYSPTFVWYSTSSESVVGISQIPQGAYAGYANVGFSEASNMLIGNMFVNNGNYIAASPCVYRTSSGIWFVTRSTTALIISDTVEEV